jgi:hypothetical protein
MYGIPAARKNLRSRERHAGFTVALYVETIILERRDKYNRLSRCSPLAADCQESSYSSAVTVCLLDLVACYASLDRSLPSFIGLGHIKLLVSDLVVRGTPHVLAAQSRAQHHIR